MKLLMQSLLTLTKTRTNFACHTDLARFSLARIIQMRLFAWRALTSIFTTQPIIANRLGANLMLGTSLSLSALCSFLISHETDFEDVLKGLSIYVFVKYFFDPCPYN